MAFWRPAGLPKVGQRASLHRARRTLNFRGAGELRERVACALNSRASAVTVDRYGFGPSGLTARCTGDVMGKRFFAKAYLADRYPVWPRFQAPWEKDGAGSAPTRPIAEQIELEWDMARRMLDVEGVHCVPRRLGRSHAARTLVWEEMKGERLDDVAAHARLAGGRARSYARALYEAGRWLRSLHQATAQDAEIVDLRPSLATLREMRSPDEPEKSEYLETALRVLERAIQKAGAESFAIPVALTHGDFCLANLIWASGNARLAVVDFELSGNRPTCYDLVSLVFDLRAQLLNPLIPGSVVSDWEKAFWAGYGELAFPAKVFVDAFALSRIFYHHLPKLLTRRERRGWIAGINARIYRRAFERRLLYRRLGVVMGNGRSGPMQRSLKPS